MLYQIPIIIGEKQTSQTLTNSLDASFYVVKMVISGKEQEHIKKQESKKPALKPKEADINLDRNLIRLCDADIFTDEKIYYALRKIKGVSFSYANAVCKVLNLDRNTMVGALDTTKISEIESVIKDPAKYGIKSWMLNRRKDYETGENKHLVSSNIKLALESDIKRLKAIKSYRGLRHALGQPSRGQKTRSHFRKGSAIGVKRKSGSKEGRV